MDPKPNMSLEEAWRRLYGPGGLETPRMDLDALLRLLRAARARSGLAGRQEWTREDVKRFGIETERLPGDFRTVVEYCWFAGDPANRQYAETCGTDVDTLRRLVACGNSRPLADRNRGESPLSAPVPRMPGHLDGIEIADPWITPS